MPEDDETPDQAGQGVKAVGVEVLPALPEQSLHRLERVPTPLVPAPVVRAPETQGDPQPEARANLELRVCEPGRCGRDHGLLSL